MDKEEFEEGARLAERERAEMQLRLIATVAGLDRERVPVECLMAALGLMDGSLAPFGPDDVVALPTPRGTVTSVEFCAIGTDAILPVVRIVVQQGDDPMTRASYLSHGAIMALEHQGPAKETAAAPNADNHETPADGQGSPVALRDPSVIGTFRSGRDTFTVRRENPELPQCVAITSSNRFVPALRIEGRSHVEVTGLFETDSSVVATYRDAPRTEQSGDAPTLVSVWNRDTGKPFGTEQPFSALMRLRFVDKPSGNVRALGIAHDRVVLIEAGTGFLILRAESATFHSLRGGARFDRLQLLGPQLWGWRPCPGGIILSAY